MGQIDKAIQRILAFRDARDWKQFHNNKDMALSLVLEAAEVLEHFQWKTGKELEDYAKSHKNEISEELADVLYWILLMAHDNQIDIMAALDKKMAQNEAKYPVEKAKGKHMKYNEL
ncbi:MAG TPA: nucleotide pyrophosphohydrolase [Candidatus Paceibacterota bacterium]|nr:nucleotide pyrophosphohydrolase [Candidatus Paceibacterota bacterium]